MKKVYAPLFAVALAVVLSTDFAAAAQAKTVNKTNGGVRYCPAPWCDNTEFFNTHFGVDAQTGEITKYTGTVHPDETQTYPSAGEQVLYAPPAVQVANRPARPAPAVRQQQPRTASPAPAVAQQAPRGRQAPQAAVAPATRQQQQAYGSAAPQKTPKRLPWWKGIFRK